MSRVPRSMPAPLAARARGRSRLATVLGALVVLATVVLPTLPASAASARSKPPSSGVFRGPNGTEAEWVIKENERPGTSSWQISNKPQHGTLDGFASLTYASVGQTVQLYVSSSAARFQVYAYRMGYYQGKGARFVWKSKELPGGLQSACPVSRPTNMVSCGNWKVSLSVKITSAFVQGDYLFKLVAARGLASYVPLTVWSPTSHAAYFVKNDVFTWQAWNDYGGYDLYEGSTSCTPTYPPCGRARVVSYDRPYDYGKGAADFLSEEYPLVEFAERRGLDVTYGTDLTVEQHPDVLENHRVLLSLGHDECWSLTERVAAENAAAHGLNIVFFGASAILRHVRLQSSSLGPDRELVDYRDSAEDPLNGKGNPMLVTGNTWSSAPTSWPETSFVGETYVGFLPEDSPHVPFVVADASSWVFAQTGLHDGSALKGVIASDYDDVLPNASTPKDLAVLGRSPVPGTSEDSDMTYYTLSKGDAGILDSGTNNWIPALAACKPGHGCAVTQIDRITKNILSVFGKGPAGLYEPSAAPSR